MALQNSHVQHSVPFLCFNYILIIHINYNYNYNVSIIIIHSDEFLGTRYSSSYLPLSAKKFESVNICRKRFMGSKLLLKIWKCMTMILQGTGFSFLCLVFEFINLICITILIFIPYALRLLLL